MWLWRASRKETGALRLFSVAAAVVGVTSFALHASFTAFFQFFDFVGMFLFAAVLLAVDLERLGAIPRDRSPVVVAVATAASAAAFGLVRLAGLPVQPLVVLEALVLVGLEVRLARGLSGEQLRWLWGALGLTACAVGFWLADYTRILCDPTDHLFQAHAVWHLLTAAAMVTLFRFYRGSRP